MKFNITAKLLYQVVTPGTIILNIHALHTPGQTITEEKFTITPYSKFEELTSAHGENRFIRFDLPQQGTVEVKYSAIVDNNTKLIDFTDQPEVAICDLDPEIFPYLYPSRYCQSDKLYRFAMHHFGMLNNTFEKVAALTDWIHENVQYLSGSTNSQTSAFDTVTELAGVCRDFAHLGIALCRALSIPARYFTGYAYKLSPPDFHACFEAFIGGQWVLFDATKLAPLNGLVKIATGRDAADTAIATIYGEVSFLSMAINSEFADNNFEPFYYDSKTLTGISYM
ncbi:transglutaminase family protein [Pedobacter sp. HMF7647]|uniref:Transglutaminase family protein n=1 Tax=Hufsiella arboris TaxID=2695275 RepID=A0A7K1Y5A8_9SPHI|nr:transglutaminase family protein [Hufsiella arboris]MXV49600.1 transglutaminase family protein [Hufsiella arboris]